MSTLRKTIRTRQPDSTRRAPMPSYLPRPVKTASGRAPTALIPAYIRSMEQELDAEDRAYIRRKLGTKLGKFAEVVERVSVRVGDVHGAHGARDKSCRIKVVLVGLPSVLVETRNASLQAAVDLSLTRAANAVRGSIGRRRTISTRPKTARRA
ncbi:MAG: hypothetical protein U1E90_07695 [Burkholderiaceae bacterium]